MPDVPLLIVGAGPVGLTMACELARHGVPCRIFDKALERSQTSKALGVFPRTLEVFETMGVIEEALRAGTPIFRLKMHSGDKIIAHLEFASIASPYPFALSLPQSETERILSERLDSLGIQVEHGLELISLTQTDDAAVATLRHADGREEVVETPWLLGCDGAHSATRHALGMQFEGAPYDQSFVLADVRAESSLPKNEVHLFFSDHGIFALFPFRGDRARIIANIPPESREQNLPEPTLDDIARIAAERGPRDLKISDAVWISRFHISHRKVASFRKLRVFLAGDAAHIHSPAGGQGMNTGIQDSFNLGWKLALVMKGHAPTILLASYNAEREPVAKGVLNLTDRMTRMATVTNPIAKSVRNALLPLISGVEFLEEKIADRMSELTVNYRTSAIVENHGRGSVRAGDRAPDGELRDADGKARRLFELFCDPNHVLLVFLGAGGRKVEPDATALPDFITTHRIARGRLTSPENLRDVSGTVHAIYDLPEGGLVIVRPDGYIAFRSDEFDFAALRNYLARNFIL